MENVLEGTVTHVENFRFRASANGQNLELDDGTEHMTPMHAVLLSLASCVAMDVWCILSKKRQHATDLEVTVHGERAKGFPGVFTCIVLHFCVTGRVTADACREAIALSIGKYCSVARMLAPKATIETTFAVT
jgi:putative redox protein